MTLHNSIRAACLTPPGAGGIAVIQVVGPDATSLVNPLIKSRRPIDLAAMQPDELRLCQVVEGDQTIDDALLCVRHNPKGQAVIDINLHGGPRLVQRVLLLLKQAGAHIVEPAELLEQSWPAQNPIEQEALSVLPKLKTRPVACWILQMKDRLPAEIERIIHCLNKPDFPTATSSLDKLCKNSQRTRYLLQGVRAVLIGQPNTGKSTLANALAEREHALVSEVPGTTRDWVEHPAAVEGIPFNFVDTAGLRKSNDPIEQEAVRRAQQQLETADIVIHIIDASCPLTKADEQALTMPAAPHKDLARKYLFVCNKSDLPVHPSHKDLLNQADSPYLLISAQTGAGLDQLRSKLAEILELANWQDELLAPFTQRQIEAIRESFAVLTAAKKDASRAVNPLKSLLNDPLPAEDRP